MRIILLVTSFLFVVQAGCKNNVDTAAKFYVNYHLAAQKVIDSLKLNKNKLYVEVDKSDYTLYIKIGDTIVKSYPVVLGFNPVDDKMKEGDGCTPEGTFKVRAKYPHASWSKFIWFDYPNTDSYKKFEQRKKDGVIPKTAKIGGEVGIHGVPGEADEIIDQKQNWTLGCVSLKTADINEIYSLVKVGTKVVIRQ
ncbi:MAG TPA: L,D-transpeptidase [Bacteroidia bacterium]|nr:L,D-transpeptidase [Bacteroidia bacterium]